LRIKIKFGEDVILRHVTTHETILNKINSSETYAVVGAEEKEEEEKKKKKKKKKKKEEEEEEEEEEQDNKGN
jgi:ribosomal protein L12E/L44/L45/RPP1/RPP2